MILYFLNSILTPENDNCNLQVPFSKPRSSLGTSILKRDWEKEIYKPFKVHKGYKSWINSKMYLLINFFPNNYNLFFNFFFKTIWIFFFNLKINIYLNENYEIMNMRENVPTAVFFFLTLNLNVGLNGSNYEKLRLMKN